MAQTWRVTPGKIAIFRSIDALMSPLRLLQSSARAPQRIERILVLEPWLLGDVVIATAALRALRDLFPSAELTLLGKHHAAELLGGSGLVDDVIICDLPWTAKTAKYDPRRYDRNTLSALIRRLRDSKFDVTVDARMDLRSNLLTRATGAPIRVGYDFGGGSALLTRAVPADPNANHRVDDWLKLVEALKPYADRSKANLELSRSAGYVPTLAVTEDEASLAEDWLATHGYTRSRPLIAVHSGASDPRRRWPVESYSRIARALAERWHAELLFFPEPGDETERLDGALASAKGTLRQMMALFSRCELVLCNDSGPMHVADALGVPVVAIFLTGNPRWHRPSREFQKWVGEGTGHDFLIPPSESQVLEAANESLAERVREPEVFSQAT
jgi:ADP-heptose:LPS heptosyltransferase